MNATWTLPKSAAAPVAILLLAAGCTSHSGNKMSGSSAMAAGAVVHRHSERRAGSAADRSMATGTASATLDPDGTLHWNVSYQGLSGPAAAARLPWPGGARGERRRRRQHRRPGPRQPDTRARRT